MTSRTISIDPEDPLPIWKQIEEGIRRLVATAALKPGAAVPSVRELAGDLQVNPATVSARVPAAGRTGAPRRPARRRHVRGLRTRRQDPSAERHRELKDAALRFASSAATLGATEEQAIAEARAAYRNLGGGERKER